MLLPTMNDEEAIREVLNDLEVIYSSSTLDRLKTDYDHERKKFKIKREDDYARFYEIKTKSKNKWFILLSKYVFDEKYKSNKVVADQSFLYNYTGHGICIYEPFFNTISAYTCHFFERYRERMFLNIPLFIDVVKAYYRNNYYPLEFYYPKDEKTKYIGLLKEGVIYGAFHEKGRMYVHKTFISYKTANLLSHDAKKELLATLKHNMDSIERAELVHAKKGLGLLYKFMAEIESGILSEKNSVRG